MKIRRILSAVLASLMALSCMSVVAFARDEAELMAIEPIKLSITTAGAKDQTCTKIDGVLDSMGRTVQQIIPDNSVNANGSSAPAWFSSDTQRASMTNSGYAYKVVKFVYYVSVACENAPTLSTWAYDTAYASNMHGCGTATALEAPKAQVGWNTAYYMLPDSIGQRPFHAFMFGIYGSDAASKHLNDTIYIGYIGLFDTFENAKAYTSDFEGDIALTGIKVGGTAVAGFNAATTSYTVDLAGKDAIPEITVTGKGNSDNLEIVKGAYNATSGTATATVNTGKAVYTLNFTGGAVSTAIAPVELLFSYAGLDQGVAGINSINDEFGRAIKDYTPAYGTQNGKYKDNVIYPGGDFGATNTGDYKVLKLVYRTSETFIPTLSSNTKEWKPCSDGVASYDVTPEPHKWNVVYFNLHNTNGNIFYYQTRLSQNIASVVETEAGAYHQIAYGGLFGSLVDAKAHKTPFEGDLDITGVKVGGNDVTFTGGVANVDASGAATVPEITLTATGNTNNVVITNGRFDTNGNATSTVANGDEILYTVNFTGGAPKEIIPFELGFEWNGYGNGIAGVDIITDEFTRTYKRYNPLDQYYENGQDKVSTSSVGPGGNLSSLIPEGFGASEYKALKLVYMTNEDYVPTFAQFTANITDRHMPSAQYDVTPAANKWNVIYFELADLAQRPAYQLYFTPDVSSNHKEGKYYLAYAGVFGSLEEAKAYKTPFEGEFTIKDVLLDGNSIGNVSTYTKDLAGAGTLPKLTAVATGDAEGVTITNGIIGADGSAVSTIKKGDDTLVTVNFTGASTEFRMIDIKVDGVSIEGFDFATPEYTFNLGFAATEPVITYTFQGMEMPIDVNVESEKDGTMVTKYIATISISGAVAYTLTFNVSTEKPEALLNTLYKLQNDKALTVGYFGGSVTAGSGASNANDKSWRGLTRDWLRSTFSDATVTEVNASIGGTGAIFGVFRADQDLIKEKAPDLVFIEMCINDNYDGIYGANEMYVYIESIVQNIYDSNPKSDIVFLITGDHGTLQKDFNGTEEYGIPYKLIGEHYNIPVIYIGRELAKTIAAENGGVYPTTSGSGIWKDYFTDGVHPVDKGYAHYAKTIIDWMTPNLPTTFVPSAEDYKAKTLPEQYFCEINNKGSLMADATMVNPDRFNKSYMGGYTSGSENKYGGHPLMGYNAGDVITLKFNGSALGMWTWSYGETNSNTYKTGTNITYSIDGGEPKTLYVYRSFANNKIYTLATGLSDGEHTIRIHHDDNKAPLHVYNFLIWDLHGRTASIDTVPYFNFDTETYSVKVGDEEFDFDPAVKSYQIPVELTAGQSYPALGFDVRDDYYGYVLEQASGDSNIAKLIIDNVGTYTFEFVNSNAVEISGTRDSEEGKANGSVSFAAAAEYALQVKAEADDWADASEYPAGSDEITGLAPGKYNIRYVIEDGVYGFAQSFTIWTIFPYDNVFYATTGGTGDGKSAKTPAAAGSSVANTIASAAAYFGDKAKTENCYIIFVGDVIHSSSTGIDTALFKNLTITSEVGAVFHMRTHLPHNNVTDESGKITYKNIDIILGNPNATTSNYNSEIMVDAKANELEFDQFNIVGFATIPTGQTRNSLLCLNYWSDGGTGAVGKGNPVTVNTTGTTFGTVRGTGYNAGNENGDATFVINGGTVVNLKLGGHVNKETITGVMRAEINGGIIDSLLLSGDAAIVNVGSVIATVNGGTVVKASVASNTDTNEANVDRVLILNNGTSIANLTKTKIDYILKGGEGGSAAATTSGNRLSGFAFTTDKELVIINKGLAGEKTLTVVDGTASIAVADLASGEYTVNYEDAPKPEGYVEIKAEISLGREAGKTPASGNHLTLVITNGSTGELVKKIDLEDSDTAVDENGTISIDMAIELGATDENATYKVELIKNGYATVSESFTGEALVEQLADFVESKAETFENGHGDIKGAYDAASGDGKVDIDDFIRVVRGFDSAATAEYGALVDLDEDGAITVKDLAIVKKNFGFIAE